MPNVVLDTKTEYSNGMKEKKVLRDLPPGVRQFIKFCIVGFSSTAIDWGLYYSVKNLIMIPNHVGTAVMGAIGLVGWAIAFEVCISNVISTGTAVLNGFYWNSRWTFRSADASNRRQQFVRFIAVNVVGMALNTTIVLYLTISLTSNGHSSNRMQILPKVVATVIVMFWNFFANKFWTFKPSKSLEPMAEVTK